MSKKKVKVTGDYAIGPYRVGWVVTLFHHVCIIITGLAGFIGTPAASVVHVLGEPLSVYLWSGGLFFCGCLAVAARLLKKLKAETVAVMGIAIFRVLWGVLILVATEEFNQTAMGILSTSFFLFGWSLTTLTWLRSGFINPAAKPPLEELVEVLKTQLEADSPSEKSDK